MRKRKSFFGEKWKSLSLKEKFKEISLELALVVGFVILDIVTFFNIPETFAYDDVETIIFVSSIVTAIFALPLLVYMILSIISKMRE